jgi:uridine phosphorylase
MEAAAFMAVAQFRQVRFGQLRYAGDDVSGPSWDERQWQDKKGIRKELFRLAVDICLRL